MQPLYKLMDINSERLVIERNTYQRKQHKLYFTGQYSDKNRKKTREFQCGTGQEKSFVVISKQYAVA